MKNTTGLYKHQRDNMGKRKKMKSYAPGARLVPATDTPFCEKCGYRTGSPAHYILCVENER